MRRRERFESKSSGNSWMERNRKSVTPRYRSPSGISREESTRKFIADRAAHSSISALRSNDVTIGIDSTGRFCDTIVLPLLYTSHWNRILPDDSNDDSRIVVIPKRFSLASLSWIVLHHIDCFILQVRANEPNFPTREMTSHKVHLWHIFHCIVCDSHFCFFWFHIYFRNIF